MRKTIGRVAAAIALIVAASSCASGRPSADGSPSPPSSSPRPSSTAELAIVAPKNGATVKGPKVELRISLEGAGIVKKTSTDLSPDRGHIHVLLDGKLISMTYGLEQEIPDLRPGLHRVQVEFVATDHAPFDPRVIVVTSFQVKG
jgi:hypothetical protein